MPAALVAQGWRAFRFSGFEIPLRVPTKRTRNTIPARNMATPRIRLKIQRLISMARQRSGVPTRQSTASGFYTAANLPLAAKNGKS
jgi:hypothetical protein